MLLATSNYVLDIWFRFQLAFPQPCIDYYWRGSFFGKLHNHPVDTFTFVCHRGPWAIHPEHVIHFLVAILILPCQNLRKEEPFFSSVTDDIFWVGRGFQLSSFFVVIPCGITTKSNSMQFTAQHIQLTFQIILAFQLLNNQVNLPRKLHMISKAFVCQPWDAIRGPMLITDFFQSKRLEWAHLSCILGDTLFLSLPKLKKETFSQEVQSEKVQSLARFGSERPKHKVLPILLRQRTWFPKTH